MHVLNRIKFSQVAEQWLETKRIEVKQSTFERYRSVTEILVNHFRDKQIRRFNNYDINEFITCYQNNGWSSLTLVMVVGVIKNIIKFAFENHYAKEFEIKVAKIKKNSRKIQTLTVAESMKINSDLYDSKSSCDLAILIALNTGLRIGEVCSLRWKDIDLVRKRLTVSGTVQRIKVHNGSTTTKLVLSTPKTTSSAREIPIPEFLCNILAQRKADSNCYILSGTEQIPEPRTVQKKFKSYCHKALGTDVNFHCLRHTFASLAISEGVDAKTVSEILGHSSVTTTLSIYRGVNFEDKAKGMRTLENFIGPRNN